MRYFLCGLLIAAIHETSFAQIVNTENQRIQSDTTGWLGNIGTSFHFEKNAIQVLEIGTNAHVEYKSKKSLYLFLINYDFLKGSGKTLNNNFFYHLRYNYKLNKWLRWEAFTQLQQNAINGIKLRLLTGIGPRFKLAKRKHVALYAATALCTNTRRSKRILYTFVICGVEAIFLLLIVQQKVRKLSVRFFTSRYIAILAITGY